MRLYIAGVVSLGGRLPIEEQERNAKRFYDAEELLRERGHDPVNPLRENPVSAETDWQAIMKTDIKLLMDCDAVYALDGWSAGRGSVIEVMLAISLDMPIWGEGREKP